MHIIHCIIVVTWHTFCFISSILLVSQLEWLGELEEENSISHKKNCLNVFSFESKGMSCIIDKGWTWGFKISSCMIFDQPSVGRAFS